MLRIVPRKAISSSCKWDTWKISKRMVNGDTQPHIFKKEFAGQSVLYKVENKIAHITLNRPERYNAIDENTPVELERAVQFANMDDDVKVLSLWILDPEMLGICSRLSFSTVHVGPSVL